MQSSFGYAIRYVSASTWPPTVNSYKQYDIPLDHITPGLKMVLTAQLMFAAACTLTKLSMLMLVRRMLCTASLVWRRITLLAIMVVSIQGTVFCITIIFQCRPVTLLTALIFPQYLTLVSRPPQDYWKVSKGPQPNCINQASSLLVAGIINTLTDFAVVLLPIRTIWLLQMPTRQALVIIMLFSFGFVSCGAGILRTYYMYKVTLTWDQTWHSYPVWMTSAIELYLGVVSPS
jgi:hypothetical protein